MQMSFAHHPAHDWRLTNHLMPPVGRIGDPNGLSQLDGIYHVFCQYQPGWPAPGMHWGHWTSPDLLTWTFEGSALYPDTPQDADGVYSGSAVARDGALWCYYTGNVKDKGNYDYINAGRQANELLQVAPGGHDFSAKKSVLLKNSDYPAWCSCHVRDPKVWRQDERWWMLLGARTRDGQGCVLLYGSDDGVDWVCEGSATTHERFGYMWECPNLVQLDGREFLVSCPQGLPKQSYAFQNLHNVGYFALDGRLIDIMREAGNPIDAAGPHPCLDTACFVELDYGFDFYAPQAFVDESGRTLLYGWVGQPDPHLQFDTPTQSWLHCLSWPRELSTNAAGRLCQMPVAEYKRLRAAEVMLTPEGAAGATGYVGESACEQFDLTGTRGAHFESGSLELEMHDIAPGQTGRILINDDIELLISPHVIELAFTSPAGRLRTVRRLATNTLSAPLTELRLVVDTSTIELYLNSGEVVFTSRWFPNDISGINLTTDIQAAEAHAWSLGAYTICGSFLLPQIWGWPRPSP